MANYTPRDEIAALFARYRRQRAAFTRLEELVKTQALEEMRDFRASTADLREHTGIAEETFRRLARKHEIERLREPTVGREVEAKRAES